jgi:predicted dehydrogenase
MPTTRRTFLSTAAAGAAVGLASSASQTAEASTRFGPNDTIGIGLIGCGGRGRSVLRQHLAVDGVRAVAVCDVHQGRLAQARKEAGGDQVAAYGDFRKLLENQDVDVVIVAPPSHWHVLATIHACLAGKDVFVEKPLGTSIGEGRAAVRVAKETGRIVQFGTQQRSWEHYHRAAEIIQSGRLGEISEVKVWDYDYFYPGFGNPPDSDPPADLDWDMYLGPAPKVPYNPNRFGNRHYWFHDYAGAWHVDWAVHHYDVVHWCMGVKHPVAAAAIGGRHAFKDCNSEWPDTFNGILQYGPGPVAKQGFLLQYTARTASRAEQRSHGKRFFGTEASLIIDRAGLTVTPEIGKSGEPESFRTAESNHAAAFLQHVRQRTKPFGDIEEGHYSTIPGHLLSIAYLSGSTIRWDAETEQVIDNPQANALVTRTYREPWTLNV